MAGQKNPGKDATRAGASGATGPAGPSTGAAIRDYGPGLPGGAGGTGGLGGGAKPGGGSDLTGDVVTGARQPEDTGAGPRQDGSTTRSHSGAGTQK
jgi:hypothetical protein